MHTVLCLCFWRPCRSSRNSPWPLEEAVETALKRHPLLEEAGAELPGAAAEADASRAAGEQALSATRTEQGERRAREPGWEDGHGAAPRRQRRCHGGITTDDKGVTVMTKHEVAAIEKTGADFSVEKMLEIRAQAQEAVRRIASRVQVGMLEEDANKMVVETLREMDAAKAFHKPYIRFGSNTTITFGADSVPGVRLGADDIYFIDIAPIWDGYEGDAGDTFVTGSNPEMRRCAADAREIFAAVAELWNGGSATGAELYGFAQRMAKERGWELNMDLGGHRLGDYSSAEHYEGPLHEISFHPSANIWMVEIHIRNPENTFGAFYEDLLVR